MADHLKVGFLGGTFDPIHNGHLNLALELSEKMGLDKVLFCPANLSPHKQEKPPTVSSEQRLEMVRLALQDLPQFEVLDDEIKRGGVSYTVETISELKKAFANAKLYLLFGSDIEDGLKTWKNPEQLLEMAELLVGSRSGVHSLDISSTNLRERLKKRLYCAHLIPISVLDYIYARDLYLAHS